MNYREQAKRDLNEWFERNVLPELKDLMDEIPEGGEMLFHVGDGLPVILIKRAPSQEPARAEGQP